MQSAWLGWQHGCKIELKLMQAYAGANINQLNQLMKYFCLAAQLSAALAANNKTSHSFTTA